MTMAKTRRGKNRSSSFGYDFVEKRNATRNGNVHFMVMVGGRVGCCEQPSSGSKCVAQC